VELAPHTRARACRRDGADPTRLACGTRPLRRTCRRRSARTQHDSYRACTQSARRDPSATAATGCSAMKRVLLAFLNRPLFVAIGVAAAAILIWFVGPLLSFGDTHPLTSEPARWVAIAVLVAGALAYALMRAARSARRNRKLMEGLVGGARPRAAPGAHDLAQIGQRFEEAIALLKRTQLGGKRALLGALSGRPFMYQLPWYVIIGAPGAGKTTALVNSGLEFPLAAKLGKAPVRGVGGTRNCDWWFASDAVLIDTAGRFTTQDSDRDADRATWFGFL